MQALRNIVAGFVVSFIGSIPMGYLNIIGFDIFSASGFSALLGYLSGVLLIEGVVIFSTLLFAEKLSKSKKLLKWIEGFSVIFMFAIALIFHLSAADDGAPGHNEHRYGNYPVFIIGIIFSSLNFIQIPFWTGWNLFLLNAGYIKVKNKGKFFYLAGTLAGTFGGMILLILFLDHITSDSNSFLAKYLMKWIIPAGFALMGFHQGFAFYKKHLKLK